jgi:hypothetical protein
MKLIPPDSSSQRFLLTPALVIGCLAMTHSHRADFLNRISPIKCMTKFGDVDQAKELVKEVWRLPDAKDGRDWDWQTNALESRA